MTEPWNTDENYRAYREFAAAEGFIPVSRWDWAAFNRSFDTIDKCLDEVGTLLDEFLDELEALEGPLWTHD